MVVYGLNARETASLRSKVVERAQPRPKAPPTFLPTRHGVVGQGVFLFFGTAFGFGTGRAVVCTKEAIICRVAQLAIQFGLRMPA